jgi:hypothetical protein
VRELELEGGETEDVAFVLRPFTMETLGVALPGPGLSVYMGAEYLGGSEKKSVPGETPSGTAAEASAETTVANGETEAADETESALAEETPPEAAAAASPEALPETGAGFFSIYVPMGQYRYVRVETEDGLTGEAIVKGGETDEVRIISLEPRKLPGKDDKPVEDKRKKFYGAYGRFWVALPAAFLINGFSQLYTTSYNASGSQSLYKDAKNLYYVSIGAWVVAGVFLVETLIRMGVYVHAASEEAVPLVE